MMILIGNWYSRFMMGSISGLLVNGIAVTNYYPSSNYVLSTIYPSFTLLTCKYGSHLKIVKIHCSSS